MSLRDRSWMWEKESVMTTPRFSCGSKGGWGCGLLGWGRRSRAEVVIKAMAPALWPTSSILAGSQPEWPQFCRVPAPPPVHWEPGHPHSNLLGDKALPHASLFGNESCLSLSFIKTFNPQVICTCCYCIKMYIRLTTLANLKCTIQ